VLYSLWLIPKKLKDDQVVHVYGFGITTWLCWQALRAGVLGRFGLQLEPTVGMMVPRESGVDVRSSLCHRSLNGVGVGAGRYYECNYEVQFPYTPNVRALGADDWKYVRYPQGDGSADKHMAELDDLKHDVEERHNLINDPEHKELVITLRKELDRLIAESGAGQDKMPMDEGVKGELPDEKIR
jgi:hypothetical protein